MSMVGKVTTPATFLNTSFFYYLVCKHLFWGIHKIRWRKKQDIPWVVRNDCFKQCRIGIKSSLNGLFWFFVFWRGEEIFVIPGWNSEYDWEALTPKNHDIPRDPLTWIGSRDKLRPITVAAWRPLCLPLNFGSFRIPPPIFCIFFHISSKGRT